MAQLTAGSTVGGYPITYQGGPITATTIAGTNITASGTVSATGNIVAGAGATTIGASGANGLIISNGFLDVRGTSASWNNGIVLRRSGSNTGFFTNLGMNSDTSFHIGVGSATVGIQIDSTGKLKATGDGQFGHTGTTSDTLVQSLAGDGYTAGFEARGSSQGSGFFYAGQDHNYGGGFVYNGDGTGNSLNPTGNVNDQIQFFRRDAGTDTVVFRFPYSSNDVVFNGSITMGGEYGNLRKKHQIPFARLKAEDHLSGHVSAAKGYSDFIVIEGGNKTIAQISVVCGNTAASGTITFDLLVVSTQNGAMTSLYTTKPTLTCGGGTVWGNITLPSSTTLNDNTVLVLKVISAPDDCWDLRVDLFE